MYSLLYVQIERIASPEWKINDKSTGAESRQYQRTIYSLWHQAFQFILTVSE